MGSGAAGRFYGARLLWGSAATVVGRGAFGHIVANLGVEGLASGLLKVVSWFRRNGI